MFTHLDQSMEGAPCALMCTLPEAAYTPPSSRTLLLLSLSEQLARAERAVQEQRFAELQRVSRRLKGMLTIRGLDILAHQASKLEMAAWCQEILLMQRALRRLSRSFTWLSEIYRMESSSSISYLSASSMKAIQPEPV